MRNIVFPRLSLGFLVLILAITANIGLYLWDPTPIQLLRNNTFDQFQRLKPRDYRQSPLQIIDVDDESLKRLGQWPWPRTQIAELVTKLQSAEPSAIALDIIFAEPDRTSPSLMMDLWRLSPDERRPLNRLPDHDQALAESMNNSPSVLAFALTQTPSRAPAAKARFVEIGDVRLPSLQSFAGAVTSLPILEEAATGNGALTFISDADGVLRRVPAILRHQDKLYPSLILESLRVSQKTGNYLLRSPKDPALSLAEIGVGKYLIPISDKGEIWLYYSKPVRARTIAAWQVMAGRITPAQLKDKILLIGTSAPGLMDLRFSPLGGIVPGIEIHAQALEQILDGSQLLRPAWHTGVEILILILGGTALGSIGLNKNILLSLTAFLSTLGTLWSASWYAFSEYRLLIDPMVPSAMLLLVFLCSSIFRHIYNERSQRWIKKAFSRYISPNLVEYLIQHPQELELGGHRRMCSFVFTDLADFTALMENLDPNTAVKLMNDYIESMVAIAFSHQGTLDRIVGDSVAIMFSAPIKQNDHQRRAILCALEMLDFAKQYSESLIAKGIGFGETRIGVHSGEVIVGNFGGKTIFDYRALGDAVNSASRLENANKFLGTGICVSEDCLAACPEIVSRPIGRLLMKGKSIPLMAYEALLPKELGRIALGRYCAAYRSMSGADPEASSAFERYLADYPEDKLAAFHWQRLNSGFLGDLIELPDK